MDTDLAVVVGQPAGCGSGDELVAYLMLREDASGDVLGQAPRGVVQRVIALARRCARPIGQATSCPARTTPRSDRRSAAQLEMDDSTPSDTPVTAGSQTPV